MNKKHNIFLVLFLAVLMAFNCGAASYADTDTDTETPAESETETSAESESESSAESESESSAESETETSTESETEGITVQGMKANGSSDISQAAVDSITIGGDYINSDGSVNSYVDFTVTVNFSEDDADGNQKSGLDIESGDTIKVGWTAPAGVSFTGYAETINLYMNGDSSGTFLGTAVVSADGVTITFNDNVTNLQHVKGSVTFTIKNYGNPDSGQDEAGTITSGGVTTNVTVKHNTGVVEFGSKGGSYSTEADTHLIDWAIWINNDALTNLTGNIVITDTLPDTETFDSFISYTYYDHSADKWHTAALSLDDFNNQSGRSFVLNEDHTITITIPASELNGKTGLIHFYTKSTAAEGTVVRNRINMTYSETDSSEPNNEPYTGSVTVPSTSGSVSGVPKGTIRITKVVRGTTDPIEGVHFRIYQVASADDKTRVSGWYNGTDYAEIVTGSDGVASLSGLNDGWYEVEEIADNLPNWIASSSLPDSVYVSIGGHGRYGSEDW